LHFIRELAPDEIADYKKCKTKFLVLRQRFSLLFILDQNFAALESCAEKLRTSETSDAVALSEINRHFMNYLFSAYALREHLETAIARDFGRESVSVSKLDRFFQLMEQKCFAYAFFQDFRNYVQHCGLPVVDMKRLEPV